MGCAGPGRRPVSLRSAGSAAVDSRPGRSPQTRPSTRMHCVPDRPSAPASKPGGLYRRSTVDPLSRAAGSLEVQGRVGRSCQEVGGRRADHPTRPGVDPAQQLLCGCSTERGNRGVPCRVPQFNMAPRGSLRYRRACGWWLLPLQRSRSRKAPSSEFCPERLGAFPPGTRGSRR
jgi:hypothetical protein